MKSLSILASAIWVMTFPALTTAALAKPKANPQEQGESIGYQCRATVRAEMKGPDCRMANPTTSHCTIPHPADIEMMDNKINECIKRGGPGRLSKTGS